MQQKTNPSQAEIWILPRVTRLCPLGGRETQDGQGQSWSTEGELAAGGQISQAECMGQAPAMQLAGAQGP